MPRPRPEAAEAEPITADAGAKQTGTPIGDEIYSELLTRIISSAMGPHGRITIDTVARDLNVSQTPVREALHRLSADGLVVRTHLSGYRVAPKLTLSQFEDLVEIRLLLEPPAARRAAEHLDHDQVQELRRTAGAMAPLLSGDSPDHDYAEFSQLDGELHDAIAAGSGNHLLHESIARLHTHVHLFRLANDESITRLAIDEHDKIVEAVRMREPDAAAYAMRQHIEASAERFRSAFDTQDSDVE